jgi:hypothetical protein
LAKKVSKRVERPMDDSNELNHSVQRVHCALKSTTDTTAMDGGRKQEKGCSFGSAETASAK